MILELKQKLNHVHLWFWEGAGVKCLLWEDDACFVLHALFCMLSFTNYSLTTATSFARGEEEEGARPTPPRSEVGGALRPGPQEEEEEGGGGPKEVACEPHSVFLLLRRSPCFRKGLLPPPPPRQSQHCEFRRLIEVSRREEQLLLRRLQCPA